MGSFANTVFSLLLGWLRGLISLIWSALTAEGGETFFTFIEQNLCMHCGLCHKTCPYEAIDEVNGDFVVDEEKCTYCGACKNSCPANAFIFERNFKDSIEGI